MKLENILLGIADFFEYIVKDYRSAKEYVSNIFNTPEHNLTTKSNSYDNYLIHGSDRD